MLVYIFGSKGQLGRELVEVFQGEYQVEGFDLPEFDITNPSMVYSLLGKEAPDLVINSAAYTNVDKAEEEIDQAFLVNEVGARLIADLANQWKAPVVYYSTDYIFDGMQRRPYKESDVPNPLNVYGQTKLAGERATKVANPKHYILRTAWLYGFGGNNFIEKMISLVQTREKVEVSEDEIGSPTYAFDLAQITKEIVKTQAYGVYHAVNSGECSRYSLIKEAFSLLKIEIPIEPCSRTKFSLPAKRPAYSVLDNSKLSNILGRQIRSWSEALRDYISRRTR
ncbi:MAG: dTDP-4-dehydrorhamnose reductase [Candidatus Hydrogenedentes bacterium]|nr:dTDP-4-dehydrorhamnose reductase [Candidatus Hydrogenedentota bacterium]